MPAPPSSHIFHPPRLGAAGERYILCARALQERQEIFEVPQAGIQCEDLADILAVEPAQIVKALFMKGIMATQQQLLSKEAAMLAAAAFGSEAIEQDEASVRVAAALCFSCLCLCLPEASVRATLGALALLRVILAQSRTACQAAVEEDEAWSAALVLLQRR
jgi:Translation initiation factor IF-2, N-terminal region